MVMNFLGCTIPRGNGVYRGETVSRREVGVTGRREGTWGVRAKV